MHSMPAVDIVVSQSLVYFYIPFFCLPNCINNQFTIHVW